MIEKIKLFAIRICRVFFRIGHIVRLNKNRVLFSDYEGIKYGCNPKYIFEAMVEKYPEVEYIWVLNNPSLLPEKFRDKVKTVKFLSLSHIRSLLTSKVIVSNLGIEPFHVKRKGQTFINTWHGGGAYKRVSADMSFYSESQKKYARALRDMRAASTDIFLSSCRRFTEVASVDFNIPQNRFVASGMARNDRLCNKDESYRSGLRRKVCSEMGIDENSLLVLYAPTFRGDHHNQREIDHDICCENVADAFERRFDRKVTFLFRSHDFRDYSPGMVKKEEVIVKDFTTYPDMQDLLDIADILITDYSSSIWDFSLADKPAFLYMPDLRGYSNDRGFYTPVDDWPYPYAENISDFCHLIESYDVEENRSKIKRHLELLGSYEDGNAAERVADLIKYRMNQ